MPQYSTAKGGFVEKGSVVKGEEVGADHFIFGKG